MSINRAEATASALIAAQNPLELSPVQTIPKIQRIDRRLFVDVAIGRCEIKPSHNDRTVARWWTVFGPDGKAVSRPVGSVRIAAAWAASSRLSRS